MNTLALVVTAFICLSALIGTIRRFHSGMPLLVFSAGLLGDQLVNIFPHIANKEIIRPSCLLVQCIGVVLIIRNITHEFSNRWGDKDMYKKNAEIRSMSMNVWPPAPK